MYMYARWIVCYPEGAGGGGPYLSVALYVDTCAFVMGRIFMNGLINVRRRQSPTVGLINRCEQPTHGLIQPHMPSTHGQKGAVDITDFT